jgi:hypothetical protein
LSHGFDGISNEIDGEVSDDGHVFGNGVDGHDRAVETAIGCKMLPDFGALVWHSPRLIFA